MSNTTEKFDSDTKKNELGHLQSCGGALARASSIRMRYGTISIVCGWIFQKCCRCGD